MVNHDPQVWNDTYSELQNPNTSDRFGGQCLGLEVKTPKVLSTLWAQSIWDCPNFVLFVYLKWWSLFPKIPECFKIQLV